MEYELAELNIAVPKAPFDSPTMAGFIAELGRITEVAERSAGFVWRLHAEEHSGTVSELFGPGVLVNLSVWTDVASLEEYVHRSAHAEVLARRGEWCEPIPQTSLVLWWVPKGHRPTLDEARARLETLRKHGPGREAFDSRHPFPPPDRPLVRSVVA